MGWVASAGFVTSAGQVLAQRVGCAVQEVGAEEGPALRCLVDEVCGQGVGVPGEAMLVCGEEQGQVMAGVAVPVDVRAGVSGAGGAGDDRTSGQRGFLSWAGSAGGSARGRRRSGRCRRYGPRGLRGS